MKKGRKALEYIAIVFAAAVSAVNYQLFIVKNNFAPAGVNGIATMIQYKSGFSLGYMSLIVNVPLCVFSFFTTNREFAVKSLIYSVVYSVVYLALGTLDIERFRYNANGVDTIYPVLIAGIIAGAVYALSFKVNSSTGGTDIISRFVSEKKKEINFFVFTFIINALVAVASFFVYSKTGADGKTVYDYKPVCLCLLYCFLSSFIGNILIKGFKSAYKFIIITDRADEICDEIIHRLKHSATRITGRGIYSGEDKEMLICVVNKHQLVDFENILKKYDGTFAFVETTNEIIGNFKTIK
ncbi:MAG TPA: hypothetical protein DDW54_03135 [Clostridiales bacterium]|nr:hypothetical protein [Clostridiales bacterium]